MFENRIIVLSPVHNEGATLELTLEAVIKQTVLPIAWVFVNDHSTDNTVDIIKKWRKKYNWIVLIESPNELTENYGPKIVSVRRHGYEYIQNNNIEYDFLAHLDADIVLPPNYFEKIVEAFNQDDRLGICGGVLRNAMTNKLEMSKKWWVRDGLRVYRKACTDQIGYQKVMWAHDSSDLLYALYKGWNVLNIDVIALHLRPTGNKMKLKYCFEIGYDIRRLGYNFICAMCKSYKYIKKRPYLIGCFYFIGGYLYSSLSRSSFCYEKEFRQFLNRFYLQNL